MSKYIDVEAFRDEMDGHYPFDKDTQDHEPLLNLAKSRIIRLLATFPSADVVEVVRCKNCKFNKGHNKCLNEHSIIDIPKDDDYCSYGKRKEQENE